jgi:hypothetical protein
MNMTFQAWFWWIWHIRPDSYEYDPLRPDYDEYDPSDPFLVMELFRSDPDHVRLEGWPLDRSDHVGPESSLVWPDWVLQFSTIYPLPLSLHPPPPSRMRLFLSKAYRGTQYIRRGLCMLPLYCRYIYLYVVWFGGSDVISWLLNHASPPPLWFPKSAAYPHRALT